VLGNDGQLLRIVGAARDVTLQKEAEETTHRHLAMLDAINSSATDAIFLKDARPADTCT
jgi:hypothetical protein